MEIVKKYVDVESGEVAGLLYQKGIYCVAVTVGFAVENKLLDADIGMYLDVPVIEVVKSMDCILYPVESAKYVCNEGVWHCVADGDDTSRDIDLYYHCSRDEIKAGDYIFNRSSCLLLNDETAFERCKTGMDIL